MAALRPTGEEIGDEPARGTVAAIWRVAWPLVVCHGLLLSIWDLGATPWWTVAVLTLAFGAWAWAVRRVGRLKRLGADAGVTRGWVVGVMSVAVVLRVLLLPLPPSLSDDVLRYAWDGRVVLAGFDPYRHPPEAEELAPLRDDMWRVMPHREVPTVYPPLALAVFAAANVTPWPRAGIGILLTIAELLGCYLLIRLAGRLGLPPQRALLYAWNPLVCLEVAGMAHVDALVVATTIAAVSALVALRRTSGAGRALRRGASVSLAAAAAVLAKIVPFVALPLWTLLAGADPARRRRFLPRRSALFAGTCLLALGLGLLPVLLGVGLPPGLVTYGVRWEFDGPLYEPLWRALDRAEVVDTVKSGLDRIKNASGNHDRWNRVYPYVYPQLLAKLALAAGFGLFVLVELLRTLRRPGRCAVAATGRLFGAVLLAMATVYPWYLLWVLPWAALCRHRAWLLASMLQVLAYLPQHVDGLELFPWFWLVTWGPVLALLVVERWRPVEIPREGSAA